jgi:hypothetical protein
MLFQYDRRNKRKKKEEKCKRGLDLFCGLSNDIAYGVGLFFSSFHQ